MARRKRYSTEFKQQALQRASEPGVTDALVCEELTHYLSMIALSCCLSNGSKFNAITGSVYKYKSTHV